MRKALAHAPQFFIALVGRVRTRLRICNDIMHDYVYFPVFETSDIFLASTLQASGFPASDLNWSDEKRCVICFKDSPELQAVVDGFWHGSLSIEPQRLFIAFKSLKAQIYSSR